MIASKSFAEKLQVEYENDCGVKFGVVTPDLIVDVVRNGVFGNQSLESEEAQRQANAIIAWLVEVEVLDGSGKVNENFDPKDELSVEIPEEFRRLKDEILDVCAGVRAKNHLPPVENFVLNKRHEARFKSKEFESLWKSIRSRTRYSVEFDSPTVVKMVKERLENVQLSPTILKPKIVLEMSKLQYTQSGIEPKGASLRERGVSKLARIS